MKRISRFRDRSAVVVALCTAMALGAVDSRGQDYNRVILVFVDVTSSLSEDELGAAAGLAGQVLAQVGVGDQFFVYPIHHDPERAQVFAHSGLPRRSRAEDRLRFQEGVRKLSQSLPRVVRQTYEEFNGPESPDDRSCILNTLYVVREAIARSPGSHVQIVYLSDMVEECASSPLGETFDLDRRDISQDIARVAGIVAEEVDCDANLLANASITVVMPTTSTSALAAGRRPAVRDLRRFWQTALGHCGLPTEEIGRFLFGTELPQLRGSTRTR